MFIYMAQHDFLIKAKTVLQTEIDELIRLKDRLGQEFVDAVEVLRTGLESGGKLIVIGIGKSENIATKIAATLSSTGAPSVVLSCQNALHGDLGVVSPGDLVLALSYSGETAELLDLLPHLKRRPVTIIAFTGKKDSTLAASSDIILDIEVQTEACPLNLAPTSSTTNMLALGDALAMVLLQSRGFQSEDYAKLHPGGSLGRQLLTRVTDIMRKGEQLALVADQGLLRQRHRAFRQRTALPDARQGEAGGLVSRFLPAGGE